MAAGSAPGICINSIITSVEVALTVVLNRCTTTVIRKETPSITGARGHFLCSVRYVHVSIHKAYMYIQVEIESYF